MKILLCGGHPNPALAVIEYLQKQKSDNQLIYVGRKYHYFEKTVTFEYQEIISKKIPFIDLNTGRMPQDISLTSLANIFLTIIGFIKSLFIVIRERPDIILSFGGYIAFPLSLVGYLLGISVYTHEQTIAPGITNKIIGRLSAKIFIAFEESRKYFDSNKTILVGNFVREAILDSLQRRQSLGSSQDKPTILVIGGSLGSHSINLIIEKIINELTQKYFVIHQIGNLKKYGDWQRLSALKNKYYLPVSHLSSKTIAQYYHQSDLVICRAGANTITELAVLKKPAILIPLPWSAYDEQLRHAQLLKTAGSVEIFDQKQDPGKILPLIEKVIANSPIYHNNYKKLHDVYIIDGLKTYLKTISQVKK